MPRSLALRSADHELLYADPCLQFLVIPILIQGGAATSVDHAIHVEFAVLAKPSEDDGFSSWISGMREFQDLCPRCLMFRIVANTPAPSSSRCHLCIA